MKQRRCFLRRRGATPLCVYLLYLLVAVSLFTGITASRYLASDSCDDSASAAAVALSTSVDGADSITLTPGGQDSYSFTVSNHEGSTVSQVALQYDVVVELSGELPQGVSVALDGAPGSGSGTVYTFSSVGTFEAGEEDDNQHTLTLTADDSSLAASVELTVTIRAEQVD